MSKDAYDGHRTAFTFRIDEDYLYPRETIRVHELARKYGVKISWYMNLKQGHHYPELIKYLSKYHDIQSHGWEHETFADRKEAYSNIKKAKCFLDSLGLKNEGYVPPYGLCSKEDIRAMDSLGIRWTSEFATGKDIFPHLLKEGNAKVWNIPAHPMSYGVLMDLNYGKENAIRYYEKLIDQLYELGLPIFLYGHSNNRLGRHPEVLEAIFKRIRTINETAKNKKERIWVTDHQSYLSHWTKNKINVENKVFMNFTVDLRHQGSCYAILKRKYGTLWFLIREFVRMNIFDWDKPWMRRYIHHGK